jgi:hypothetical protein
MAVRQDYDHMTVERIPESLTWVRTSVIPGSAKESSRGGNVLSPVSATATSIANGYVDIEECVSDSLAK